MLTCPICDCEMGRGDVRRGSFPCPHCKARLQLRPLPGAHLATVGSALLAILIPYSAGAQGYAFVLAAVVVFLVIFCVSALVAGIIFAKLEIYQDPDDTRILKI